MKKRKKLIAIIVAIIMVLINIIPIVPSIASITEDTNTGSITVTGLEAGVTAYAYQLTTVNYDYTSDQPEDPEYMWISELQDWLTENYSDYIDDDGSVSTSFNDEDVTDSSDFYSALISAIRAETISLDVTDTQTTEGEQTYPVEEENCTSEVTFSGLEMGTYLVLVENGYRVYTPVVTNLVPEYDEDSAEWVLNDVEAECKSTNPTITIEPEIDNYSTADEITFTITADIPTYLEDSLAEDLKVLIDLGQGLALKSVEAYTQTLPKAEIIDGGDDWTDWDDETNEAEIYEQTNSDDETVESISYNAHLNRRRR